MRGVGTLALPQMASIAASNTTWQKKLETPQIPINSGLIFPFAGSVLVYGREQLLL
jgi:hypothetical protein